MDSALLDSCVWIALEKGEINPEQMGSVWDTPLRTSPMVIAELKYGVESTNNPLVRNARQAMLDKALRYEMLSVTTSVAMQFGTLNAYLRQQGKTRQRVQDLWIASTAIVHGASLVTLNGNDFADIPDLKLIVI